MNTIQTAYAIAKAQYETSLKLVNARIAVIPEPEGEGEDLDAYCEMLAQIEEELNHPAAFKALAIAEDALLKWAQEYSRTLPGYKTEIEKVFEAATWNLKIRNKAIDLAFRLSA